MHRSEIIEIEGESYRLKEAVSGLSSIITIGAGLFHTCAVRNDGSAACWGYNTYGQLGNGTTTNATTAVGVRGLSNIKPSPRVRFASFWVRC